MIKIDDMTFISFYCWFYLLFVCYAGDTISAANSSGAYEEEYISGDVVYQIDSLFKGLSIEKGFNGNVLIAQKGRIIYKNSFGYADLGEKTPLNIESTFQLASITKQFTAMAIMMLYEEGRLNFTDTLQRFFPEFPYKNITIHQLLTHRSGLPEYMYFSGRYWRNKKHLMSNIDVLDMMITYKPGINFLPDRKYKYCNTGYALLASIVEQVSGLQYHVFLERRIFKPLNMQKTFVYNTKKMEGAENITLGYKNSRRQAEEDYLCGVVGDKGIYSTVEDIFKWDQALYTEKLIKQSTLQEAFTPFSYNWRDDNSYGYGWRIMESDSGKIVYHAGLWRGYNGVFARRLQDKTTIIVLCNKVNSSFESIDQYMGILDSAQHKISSTGGD
ncbi:MAG: beta-lactamase family protein [Bacteroidetes bacterium]|nr:beta-lactamase family protein [Bacteroidota bacterium]